MHSKREKGTETRMALVGQRQSYKNKVETRSSHCPLERQMPGDVEHTVSVSMETEEGTTLKHCRADRHGGKSRGCQRILQAGSIVSV